MKTYVRGWRSIRSSVSSARAAADRHYAERILTECLREGICGLDCEANHFRADEILCAALASLGFRRTVAEWRAVRKWYA